MADPVESVRSKSDLRGRARKALKRTQSYFFTSQHQDGYWWGELESNATMEAEYLMLTRFLGSDEGDRTPRVAEDIRRRQQSDGSWNMYHKGPGDLSTSIECYFALKLAGDSSREPHMMRACEFILSRGGVPRARVFTKIWLALFGQWEWAGTPRMPPELMLVPRWAPFSIYKFSSWARATIVPLTVVLTLRPTRKICGHEAIPELYPSSRYTTRLPRRNSDLLSLESLFLIADACLGLYEKLPFKIGRKRALREATKWMTDHQEADGSWGGIQPPWVYSLIALSVLGYPLDHSVLTKGLQGFRDKWSVESQDGQSLRVQACLSPLWDTGLVLLGLLDSGVAPNDPVIQKATKWVVGEEIHSRGDWAVLTPKLEPSGWAFEFENDWYPDIDDTSIIVAALDKARVDDETGEQAKTQALDRAVKWLSGMQSKNGGWAAFDRDNTATYLAKIPFADFGELLDPPSADVTAHVLEMFGRLGYSKDDQRVRRGLEYLWDQQEPDGSWFGRWGVNYLWGTAAVLPALRAVGEDMSDPRVKRAVRWLSDHQNDDGGWGESCASYADPSLRGKGESTPSQTAWAVVALLSACEIDEPPLRQGIKFLLDRQLEDGTWDEDLFTGCGFPGYGIGEQPDRYKQPGDPNWQGLELGSGFMIKYHLYRNYFPLWALGRFVQRAAPGR